MTSLLTNVAAMSALTRLSATQRQQAAIENEVSTGLRVATASDDAAYWSIGVSMRSQAQALAVVNDGLALTAASASVAATALGKISQYMQSMRNSLILAQQSGVDLGAIQLNIKSAQQGIGAVASEANVAGQNWLIGSSSLEIDDVLIESAQTTSQNAENIRQNLVGPAYGTVPFDTTVTHVTTTTGVDDLGNIDSSNSITSGSYTTNLDGSITQNLTTSSDESDQPSTDSDRRVVSTIGVAQAPQFITTKLDQFYLFDDIQGVETNETALDYTDVGPTITFDGETGDHASYQEAVGTNKNALDASFFIGPTETNLMLMSVASASLSDIKTMQSQLDKGLSRIATMQSQLGSLEGQISTQKDFNTTLSDALLSGVGSLVDADMNVVSTRLQALQTQELLGLQSLSIANESSRLILKLFAVSSTEATV